MFSFFVFFFLSFVLSVVFRFAGTLLCDEEDEDDAGDEVDVEKDGKPEDDDVDGEPDEDDEDNKPPFVPTFSPFHRSKLSLRSSARRMKISFSVGARAIQSLFKRSSRSTGKKIQFI